MKPDPKHIKNLSEAAPQKTLSELHSFLGMAGYSMRFIPDFASMVHPLRQMLKSKKWDWNQECNEAFERLKKCLTEQTLLHHYIPSRETEVIVDASNTGLGAILTQKANKNEPFHAVAYKSRTLKDAETRYSTTEREALAIRWGVKKLRHLLLGAHRFKVVTDHKPLTFMFNKTHGDLPPRIERFVMDLQEFDFVVEHRPGKDCIADYMSRNPSRRQGSSPAETIEKDVSRVLRTEMSRAINDESQNPAGCQHKFINSG